MDGRATLTIDTLIRDMKTATSRIIRMRQRAGSWPSGCSVVLASDFAVYGGRASVILYTILVSPRFCISGNWPHNALLHDAKTCLVVLAFVLGASTRNAFNACKNPRPSKWNDRGFSTPD